MIGVVCAAEHAALLEELFQLFKTPWEFHEPGRVYDVVLATTDDIPEVETSLLVISSASFSRLDDRLGLVATARLSGGELSHRGVRVPVHGALMTFEAANAHSCVLTADGAVAGVTVRCGDLTVARLGYDLAHEIQLLLGKGQTPEHAHVPTLDVHIAMLREVILDAGLPLLEIPAAPAGFPFAVCLTHDIDFAGIRHHRADHTMWGFLYRATVGALVRTLRGRLSLSRCLASWRAALSLPFVHLGRVKDFWEPFGWYLDVERGLPATYFLIPFKGRPGERVPAPHASRRSAAYDLADLADGIARAKHAGCELGVHGIDAWHSVERGREELARIRAVSGGARVGVRMHWLLRDEHTPRVLEDAGYVYDSSVGFNETVGYRSGTTQPFRAPGATSLLELPLHIQDGALFYPGRLDLSGEDAWRRCRALLENAQTHGGVLTVLWHDRSHAPERFWGDFYVRLVGALEARGAWFGTAGQVIEWFRMRRAVRFERAADGEGLLGVRPCYRGEAIDPPLTIRVHRPRGGSLHGFAEHAAWTDLPWSGGPRREAPAPVVDVAGRAAEGGGAWA